MEQTRQPGELLFDSGSDNHRSDMLRRIYVQRVINPVSRAPGHSRLAARVRNGLTTALVSAMQNAVDRVYETPDPDY